MPTRSVINGPIALTRCAIVGMHGMDQKWNGHNVNEDEHEYPVAEALERPRVDQLDAILGHRFEVLDHGFIRVIDYMGSDASVVQAARVSYGSGTKGVRDDTTLIRYLMRNHHSTPFEMCELKIHVKLPIFVARQWIRHRTASVNEYSGRYSVIDNEFYVPSPEAIAGQSVANRQGREVQFAESATEAVLGLIRADAERSYATYQELLGGDGQNTALARELARIGLGVNFYTQWYWKVDLHNLMNFLRLRADPHAQYEIRVYAERLLEIVALWVPATHQAFLDYQLNARSLSSQMLDVVRRRIAGEKVEFATSGLSRREWDELAALIEK